MVDAISLDSLNLKYKDIRDSFPENVRLRIHRAISWLTQSKRSEEIDAQFVFQWVAFNAAYADRDRFHNKDGPEFFIQKSYFEKLGRFDKGGRIDSAIRHHFWDSIKSLMNNKYVFHGFWEHQHGFREGVNWEKNMQRLNSKFMKSYRDHDVAGILEGMFSRLYVLRNQLMHGGATQGSSVNRDQVKDGTEILSFLIPEFIDLMMDNPNEDWGGTFYPVVKDN